MIGCIPNPAGWTCILLALVLISCNQNPKSAWTAPDPDLSHLSPPKLALIDQARIELEQSSAGTATERSQAWGELAQCYHGLDLRLAAKSCYLRAIELHPQESRWHYLLGLLLQELAKPEEAYPHFQKVAELNPGYLPNLLALADYQARQGMIESAETHYKKILDKDPEQVAAIAGLAALALESRNFQQALNWAQKGLAIAPKVARLHYISAMALRGLEDFSNSESAFEQSQKVDGKLPLYDPFFEPVHELTQRHQRLIEEGLEAEKTSLFDRALAKIQDAIAWEPKSARARYEHGRLLNKMGRYQDAIASLEKSGELGPDQAPVAYQLGVAKSALGQGEPALQHMKKAAEIDPMALFYHLAAGDQARRLRRFQEALSIYQRALEHHPQDWRLHMGRALSQIYLEQYSEAVTNLETLTARPQTPGPFYLLLARLYAASPNDGVRNGEKAVKLVKGLASQGVNLDYLETGAMAMAEAGDFEQAVEWQNAALELSNKSLQRGRSSRIRERLSLYREKTPCRKPFENDAKIFFDPLG